MARNLPSIIALNAVLFFVIKMPLLGCEICLKLQKAYSEALRKYVNALDVQTRHIERADYPIPAGVRAAIAQADTDCATARRMLGSHEIAEHQKKAAHL